MAALPTFWDYHFRPPLVLANGVELPRRAIYDFITSLSVEAVADDPTNETTRIAIPVPGGAVGDLQFRGEDVGGLAVLEGTTQLRVVDGELVHAGTPLHLEAWSDFKPDAEEPSFARAQWGVARTTNATPATVATVALPDELGDGFFVIHGEVTYYLPGGGGALAYKASFQRTSGVLSRVGIVDVTLSGLKSGAATGGGDIDASGDEAAVFSVTGILATAITWIGSLHIQAAVPS